MHTVELYRKVRLACRDGMSECAAARHFGISRESVKKMLCFSVPPGYRRTAPVQFPADPFPLRIGRHHGTLAPPAGILPHGRHPSEKACVSCDTADLHMESRITPSPRKLLMIIRLVSLIGYVQSPSIVSSGSYRCSSPASTSNSPERNSSLKFYRILCCSNQPHLSLTGTLSRCIITKLQEEPATLRQPQCTENQN